MTPHPKYVQNSDPYDVKPRTVPKMNFRIAAAPAAARDYPIAPPHRPLRQQRALVTARGSPAAAYIEICSSRVDVGVDPDAQLYSVFKNSIKQSMA
jgi:hypothetical protein